MKDQSNAARCNVWLLLHLLMIAAGAVLATTLVSVSTAQAWTFATIYSSCSKIKCRDGNVPNSHVLIDPTGRLFGTTTVGGRHDGHGVVFEIFRHGTGWNHRVLHYFCAYRICDDGEAPYGLIADASENFYGTTVAGGGSGAGVFYELLSNEDQSEWTFQKLFDFPSSLSEPFGLTYAGASTGMPYDGVSPLYGYSYDGLSHIFELTRGDQGWSAVPIYTFTAGVGGGMSIVDGQGNIFGYTSGDGNGDGTLFELSLRNGIWTKSVLHVFCQLPACADGVYPTGILAMNASGYLYGEVFGGGLDNCYPALGCGGIFRLYPNGEKSKFDLVRKFCSELNCSDGRSPQGGLAIDAAGNIFGTTPAGGDYDGGTVFRLKGKRFQTLYSLPEFTEAVNGVTPDISGNLFGTTNHMVFELAK